MKRVDVTKSVMEKVTRFERERSGGWLWRFRIVIAILLALAVLVLWRAWEQLKESHTLDLLTLFWQDMEIIREFWQDTLLVFLEELPREALLIAGLVLLGIGVVARVTRKKRKVMTRRLTELAKRKKN